MLNNVIKTWNSLTKDYIATCFPIYSARKRKNVVQIWFCQLVPPNIQSKLDLCPKISSATVLLDFSECERSQYWTSNNSDLVSEKCFDLWNLLIFFHYLNVSLKNMCNHDDIHCTHRWTAWFTWGVWGVDGPRGGCWGKWRSQLAGATTRAAGQHKLERGGSVEL